MIDNLLTFSEATACEPTVATALHGSQIDLEGVGLDLGCTPMYFVAMVDTAFTSNGSATVQVKLVSDDSASISTTTSTVHYASAAIPVASLVAGYKLCVRLPLGTYEQYLGVLTVTGTQTLNTGKFTTYLTDSPELIHAYPDAR